MMQLVTVIRSLIKIIPVVIKHCPATPQFAVKVTLRLISNYSWVDDNEFCGLQRAQVYVGWNLCHTVCSAETFFLTTRCLSGASLGG